MSHGPSSVSTAAGFIDMATFSELESFLYGGPHAVSLFVAGVQKANWFTVIPIQLRNNGHIDFGAESVSSSINRSGDYVLNLWFRAEIPAVTYAVQNGPAGGGAANTVRWTRNLMHNLIKNVTITFNELIVEEFNNFWLDNNYQFRLNENKRIAYKNMIGDVPTMINFINSSTSYYTNVAAGGPALWGGFFSVILPFWFGEDSGIALPIAALPFNDVKLNYELRNADDLLVFNGPNPQSLSDLTFFWQDFSPSTGTLSTTIDTNKNMRHAYTFAHYAVVHNDERVKMGDAPRDILMRQIQTVIGADVVPGAHDVHFDIRLSHGIIQYFFGMRNKTYKGEWSNYTTNVNYGTSGGNGGVAPQGNQGMSPYWDPIHSSMLIYENTTRLAFDVDFYALIQPYLFSEATPDETGYHMWTFGIKPWDPLQPSASTNFSKLANVQIRNHLSNRSVYYLNNPLPGTMQGSSSALNLKMHSVFVGQNWNIVRVANGSLGHPTL
jgi:hypothetical protein